MRSIITLIVAQIFLLLSVSCAQTRNLKAIPGEYLYTDSFLNAGIHSHLKLFKDGKYEYEEGTHMQKYHSSGKWTLKGDILTLNSSINRKNIPVTIREKIVDSLKENISFSLVKNLDGDIMDAIFYFNGDTTRYCIPLLESGCDKKVGTIDSFKIGFSHESYTPWFKLKNKKNNLLDVSANVHDVLALYLFFDDEKFIYKDGKLQAVINDKNKNRWSELTLRKLR